MKKLLALLIACLALTVTACGDDDDDGGGDSGGGATTTEQKDSGEDSGAGTGGQGATSATVDMKDIKYVPESLTVPAGSTITWTNSDEVPHTVTKTDGPGEEFDSGNIEGGGEYELTVKDAGTINYECVIHPGQTGSITVE